MILLATVNHDADDATAGNDSRQDRDRLNPCSNKRAVVTRDSPETADTFPEVFSVPSGPPVEGRIKT